MTYKHISIASLHSSLVIALAILCYSSALAQTTQPQIPPSGAPEFDVSRPGDFRLKAPVYKPEKAGPKLELPPVIILEQEKEKLSGAAKIHVQKFVFEGNSVFSSDELGVVVAAYAGREITTEQLQEARRRLSLYYIRNGYINSGATIPDQAATDGIIKIQIIEGVLKDIKLAGNKKLRDNYIVSRLRIGAGPPLNINNLQKRLQLLQQSPLIKSINAELRPGLQRGESQLNVLVNEEFPHHLWIRIGNNQSPSVGSDRGEIQYVHGNLAGFGDTFSLRAGRAKSLEDFETYYEFPVTAYDTTIKLLFRKNDSTVIERPFQHLDINSESETRGLTLSHPIYKTTTSEFSLSLGLEHIKSQTYLLGRPFSFSESAEDGKEKVTVLRINQSWTDRSQKRVFAARSTFNFGLDAFDSTINESGEDSRFFSWLGQLQWAKLLSENGSQVIFRTDVQLSHDALLPLERFAIGGSSSVRGYRENQLVRDNGLVLSLELLVPVMQYKGGEGLIQLAPFVDYGKSWNTEGATPDPDYIASVGLGLKWTISSKSQFQIYYGYPLKNVEQTGHTLQEEGVHFQFSSELF